MKSVISENLVKNGTFSNTGYWQFAGAKIIQGKAVLTNNSYVSQKFKLPANSLFRIIFTVSGMSDEVHAGEMLLMARGAGSVEKDLVMKITGAKTYEVNGSLSEHWDSQKEVELYFSASSLNGGYTLDDVQLYLTDGIDLEPGQLLENGYFSDGLEHWAPSEKVVANEGKAFLPEHSNIQQTVHKESDKNVTLKFNVSSCKNGGGTVKAGFKSLTFSKDGLYTLESPGNTSGDDRVIRFDAIGSFELDNVELFVPTKTAK